MLPGLFPFPVLNSAVKHPQPRVGPELLGFCFCCSIWDCTLSLTSLVSPTWKWFSTDLGFPKHAGLLYINQKSSWFVCELCQVCMRCINHLCRGGIALDVSPLCIENSSAWVKSNCKVAVTILDLLSLTLRSFCPLCRELTSACRAAAEILCFIDRELHWTCTCFWVY